MNEDIEGRCSERGQKKLVSCVHSYKEERNQERSLAWVISDVTSSPTRQTLVQAPHTHTNPELYSHQRTLNACNERRTCSALYFRSYSLSFVLTLCVIVLLSLSGSPSLSVAHFNASSLTLSLAISSSTTCSLVHTSLYLSSSLSSVLTNRASLRPLSKNQLQPLMSTALAHAPLFLLSWACVSSGMLAWTRVDVSSRGLDLHVFVCVLHVATSLFLF